MLDFIMNGQGHGATAQALIDSDFDVLTMRPYRGANRLPYISQPVLNQDGSIKLDEKRQPIYKAVCVANSGITAALRRDDWLAIDDTVLQVAKPALRFVGDLRARGLTYTIPNGFGKTVLAYEDSGDIADAEMAMDPDVDGRADRPVYTLNHLPLPVVFKDFWFSNRQIAVSRNSSTPLDTTMVQQSTEKVAEMIEKLALGVAAVYKFAGGRVYGLTNFPGRLTKVLTLPTAGGWTPMTLLDEMLAMKQQSQDNYHSGPWVLYVSPAWGKYLDSDFSAAKGDLTLRGRVKLIDGIEDIRDLNFLTGYQAILCEMKATNIREVIGMEIVPVQWNPTPFRTHFKVLGIMVPQLRADQLGQTGVVHGVAA